MLPATPLDTFADDLDTVLGELSSPSTPTPQVPKYGPTPAGLIVFPSGCTELLDEEQLRNVLDEHATHPHYSNPALIKGPIVPSLEGRVHLPYPTDLQMHTRTVAPYYPSTVANIPMATPSMQTAIRYILRNMSHAEHYLSPLLNELGLPGAAPNTMVILTPTGPPPTKWTVSPIIIRDMLRAFTLKAILHAGKEDAMFTDAKTTIHSFLLPTARRAFRKAQWKSHRANGMTRVHRDPPTESKLWQQLHPRAQEIIRSERVRRQQILFR